MATVKKTSRSRVPSPKAPAVETLDAAVDAAFREDDGVRAVLSKRLSARAAETEAVASRAAAAFADFRPTLAAAADRASRTYLGPGEDIGRASRAVLDRGVEALRATADRRTMRIRVEGELRDLVSGGRIALGELLGYLGRKLAEAPMLQKDPVRTACDAEAAADAVLAKAEGQPAEPPAGPPAPPADGPSGNGDGPRVREYVRRHVDALLEHVAAPEERLRYAVESRAGVADADQGVQSFQLRAGASDVTSYHDFRALHIAFEHIWTELFDGKLAGLGRELYQEAVKLEGFLKPDGSTQIDYGITSIPDLLRLLQDIRELSGRAEEAAPQGKLPGSGSLLGLSNTFGKSGLGPTGPAISKWFVPPPPKGTGGAGGGAPVKPEGEEEARVVPVIPGAERLSRLLQEIERRLRERYAFSVFAKDAYNFGFLVTYRQTWQPERYQVGDLVSTLPLAPREMRRYTTKRVVKKTRAVKEVEDSLRTRRTETSGTSRVEREIVDKAQQKSNWDLTVQGTIGGEGYEADTTAKAGGESATQSEKAKKHFHESVLKSAEEYKQQHRMEVDTTTSEESEETTFHEIQNPNEELTVTYMFYELQRTYRIREQIHQLTPVVLVANEVPAPDAIDDAWLVANDWILRRVILDDSFRPALDYLSRSFVGAELDLQILENNARAQKQVVDKINQQIAAQSQRLEGDERRLADAVKGHVDTLEAQGVVNSVKRIFDPLGITGKEGEGAVSAQETMVDYLQETFDRAEREKARLLEQLGVATTALQAAIDKLSAATKEHYGRIAEVDRLRIHVKQNILYYMQAIWSHEPRDQRFFRIYNLDVLVAEPVTAGQTAPIVTLPPNARAVAEGGATTGVSMGVPDLEITKRKLVEIADLDNVLGYKGNYAIYALNENNFITLSMMQDYLDVSDDVRLRDPDEFGDYTVEDLQKLAECMFRRSPTTYATYREQLKQLIIKRLTSGRAGDDRVIVPTESLYIEALVGTHPLLEDFKLIHRALDVKKVQAETRRAELENLRLAARALRGKDEDPDIEKKIVIDGPATLAINPDDN